MSYLVFISPRFLSVFFHPFPLFSESCLHLPSKWQSQKKSALKIQQGCSFFFHFGATVWGVCDQLFQVCFGQDGCEKCSEIHKYRCSKTAAVPCHGVAACQPSNTFALADSWLAAQSGFSLSKLPVCPAAYGRTFRVSLPLQPRWSSCFFSFSVVLAG